MRSTYARLRVMYLSSGRQMRTNTYLGYGVVLLLVLPVVPDSGGNDVDTGLKDRDDFLSKFIFVMNCLVILEGLEDLYVCVNQSKAFGHQALDQIESPYIDEHLLVLFFVSFCLLFLQYGMDLVQFIKHSLHYFLITAILVDLCIQLQPNLRLLDVVLQSLD